MNEATRAYSADAPTRDEAANITPSPEAVEQVSPEGRPAESDRLSKHRLHELMLVPLGVGVVVAIIVGVMAGLVAGLLTLVLATAMAAVFNPVFWASAARAEDRSEASRNEHPTSNSR